MVWRVFLRTCQKKKPKAGEVKQHKRRGLGSCVPCKSPLKGLLRTSEGDMKCLCDTLEQSILTVLPEIMIHFPGKP